MFRILSGLTLLVSPILAYTGDEIWKAMPHAKEEDPRAAVLNSFPAGSGLPEDAAFVSRWDRIHAIRDDVKKALEKARKQKVIGAALDAKVTLHCTGELYTFAKSVEKELLPVLIVSAVEVQEGGTGTFTDVVLPLTPSTCYFEATPVSLGRGTDKPFQVYGHPDMKGYSFSFTPRSVPGAKNPPQLNKLCHGVDLSGMSDEEIWKRGLDLSYVIDAYRNLNIGDKFFTSFFEKLIGVDYVRRMIEDARMPTKSRPAGRTT